MKLKYINDDMVINLTNEIADFEKEDSGINRTFFTKDIEVEFKENFGHPKSMTIDEYFFIEGVKDLNYEEEIDYRVPVYNIPMKTYQDETLLVMDFVCLIGDEITEKYNRIIIKYDKDEYNRRKRNFAFRSLMEQVPSYNELGLAKMPIWTQDEYYIPKAGDIVSTTSSDFDYDSVYHRFNDTQWRGYVVVQHVRDDSSQHDPDKCNNGGAYGYAFWEVIKVLEYPEE